METIDFNLDKILLREFSLAPDVTGTNYANADFMWHFAYDLSFFNLTSKSKNIRIDFSFKLHLKNDPDENSIAFIKINSSFTTARNISPKAKLYILCQFLEITLWNLQGIYALKTEGTPLDKTMPPVMDFSNHSEHLNKRIYYDWK